MVEAQRHPREYLRGVARVTTVVAAFILACWLGVLLRPTVALTGISVFLILFCALFAVSGWPHRVGLLGILAVGVIFFDELIQPLLAPSLIGYGLRKNSDIAADAVRTLLQFKFLLGAQGARIFCSNCSTVISRALDLVTNDVFVQALGGLAVLSWLAGHDQGRAQPGSVTRRLGRRLSLAGLVISAAATLYFDTDLRLVSFAFLIGTMALSAILTGRRATALLIIAFCGAAAFHAALGLTGGLRLSKAYELFLLAAFVAGVSERPWPGDKAGLRTAPAMRIPHSTQS